MNSKVDTTTATMINAFVDGELDLRSQLDIEARMLVEPGLRDEVESLRQLRTTLRNGAGYHAAPAALRARLAASRTSPAAATAGAPASATSRAAAASGLSQLGETLWRWLAWRPLVASLGVVAALAVGLNLVQLRNAQDDRLLDAVVASHVRATLSQHLVDVSSSDHHTVKPWLSSRLDFSPPVNELPLPGSVFLGGRVDYLDGRPVAALVYRQGEHVVNAFIWPSTAKDSTPDYELERGYQTAHWSHAGMNHWVISDLNRQEFGAVVQAIARSDGPPQ